MCRSPGMGVGSECAVGRHRTSTNRHSFCRCQMAIARSCALAPDKRLNDRWRKVMKTRFTVALSLLAGAALGAAAVQGLHAQTKPKAYIVTETEVLDAAALAAYVPQAQAAARAAGGRPGIV